jgi:hypothetical protein
MTIHVRPSPIKKFAKKEDTNLKLKEYTHIYIIK